MYFSSAVDFKFLVNEYKPWPQYDEMLYFQFPMVENYEIEQVASMVENLVKLQPDGKSDPVMAKTSTALLKTMATVINERDTFVTSQADDVLQITK